MAKRILVVFTYRSINQLLAEGGSQAWALNQANARRCSYVVCTRNRHHEDAAQQEEHGAAFLVGKISSVEELQNDPGRFIVRFDRYALVKSQPVIWPGARNPVWYVDDFRSRVRKQRGRNNSLGGRIAPIRSHDDSGREGRACSHVWCEPRPYRNHNPWLTLLTLRAP
jgi:hypothetical protein